MAQAHTTWFLIADSARARIVSVRRHMPGFETIATFDSEEAHQLSRDLGSDRPGRAHESASPTRHAVEPRSDPQRVAKQRFDRAVAETLNRAAAERRFDALFLIAPPRTLGDLRQELDDATRAKVREELDKDWVKLPEPELEQQLNALLRPA